MLFSEFREGTGCRDNEYNYKVYRDLEVMYMNSNLSKAEIYAYGKKLVDNTPSEKELELQRQIKEEIAELQEQLKQYRADVKRYTEYHRTRQCKEDMFWKHQLDWSKSCVRRTRNKIRRLKWVLEA